MSSNIRLRQCKACPWKVSTVPGSDIPNGYCEKRHADLENTIAPPGQYPAGPLVAMACHETEAPHEMMCAGWIHHQFGPGNNIALRMLALDGRFKDVRVDGPQHDRFEDTLP